MRIWRVCAVAWVVTVPTTGVLVGSGDPEVRLRSGVIRPSGQIEDNADRATSAPQRMVVRFKGPPGALERSRLEGAGARIEAPLPGWAYLVSVPSDRTASLSAVARVDWATPYLPSSKIAPEIATAGSGGEEEVVVLLHLFPDADPAAVAASLSAQGLRVEGAERRSRFGRIVLRATPEQLDSHLDGLAQHNDVFWIDRRHRRTLINDNSIWVGQSGLYAGETTPVFDKGVYGEGQIGAVLDTGLDADMCYFRDGTLGLPPTNTGSGTVVDTNQRKVLAVDFLDPGESPADPTHWGTHDHGTHVAGTMAGDDLANPLLHDIADGMAPGARLVIQDAGYAADACGDLPGIGCPVTDLNPIFQQAYDQGARVHNNSWNDNENAAVQNIYTDASQDVDEFIWNHSDFLIVFGAGNQGLGGSGTVGSPSTAKNGMSVGATYWGEFAENLADISSWGPTDDGRIKPDVVFPGQGITSANNDTNVTTDNCDTVGMSGTSMASPGVAGSALLVRQYFADGFYPTGAAVPADGFDPSAALVKAMLINSAVPIMWDNMGNAITIPSDPQGWGRVLLDNSMYFIGDERGLWVDDHTSGFTSPSDAPVGYQVEVLDSSEPFKVTLVWNDFPSTPAASTHLINDLDLRVDGASGSYHGNFFQYGESRDHGVPDRLNNVEQVLVNDPAPGVYSIEITPHTIPAGPQPWALVVSGKFVLTAGPRPAYLSHVIDDSGPNGNNDGVLDPGETAIIPVTLRNSGDADATSVLGNLYSQYPALLKVYDNTSSYANMPVGGQAGSTAPHYSVTLEPSATCEQVLGTSMSIAGEGFEVGSAFSIDIGLRTGDYPSTDTPLQIPKSSTTGVWSFLNIPFDFPYNEVDVTVNIDHEDISELQLLLYSPTNTAINLHRLTDPGVSGIHTTYDELTVPHGPGDMNDFLDMGPAGSWRLRAIDAVGGGTPAGTIQDWTLHFKSDVPFNCHPVSCGDPVPPSVPGLSANRSGVADAVLTWSNVGASDYHVWWDEDPASGSQRFGGSTGGATTHTDFGAPPSGTLRYFQVRATNSCRWEGP